MEDNLTFLARSILSERATTRPKQVGRFPQGRLPRLIDATARHRPVRPGFPPGFPPRIWRRLSWNASLTTGPAEQSLHSLWRILRAAFGAEVARQVAKAALVVGRVGGSG